MHLFSKCAFVVTLAFVCAILGCGDTEDPLKPIDSTDKHFSSIAATKIPPVASVAAAPAALATTGTPSVTSVSYYTDWKLTKPLTGTVAPGTTFYTKIVFSEPMTLITADDNTARPILYYQIEGQRTRYRIAKHGASGADFQSGDAKPKGSGTQTFVCKYTVPAEMTGTFKTAVGKLSTDTDGNPLAKFYVDTQKLQLGTSIAVTAPTVTEVGFYSNWQLTRRITGVVESGDTVYTKVVFSEPMTHVPGDADAARPVLSFLLNETETGYRVLKSGSLGSGDCKPKGKDLTTWLCKWMVGAEDGGTFTVKVGEASTSQPGVGLAEGYVQRPPVQVGVGEIELSTATVAENAALGTLIGELSYSRVVSPSYRIVNTESDALFSIDASGQLLTKVAFDYETRSEYDVEVEETMTGRLETFEVEILDVNEAPTDVSLSGTTIYESDGIGTRIGDIRVADPNRDDSWTFELLAGSDYFEIVGNTLQLLQPLPSSSQAIEIRVTDSGGLVYTESFTITLESRAAATEDTSDSTDTTDDSTSSTEPNDSSHPPPPGED